MNKRKSSRNIELLSTVIIALFITSIIPVYQLSSAGENDMNPYTGIDEKTLKQILSDPVGYLNKTGLSITNKTYQGDWVIKKDTTIKNKHIFMRGSIVVNQGAKLHIIDSTITFVTFTYRAIGIRVMPGGYIEIESSTIKPLKYNYKPYSRYYVWIDGDAKIIGSKIIAPWGGGNYGEDGLGAGIFCKGGNIYIDSTEVYDSLWGSITIRDGTKATIKNFVADAEKFFMGDENGNNPTNTFAIWLLNYKSDEIYFKNVINISGGKVNNALMGINMQDARADISKISFKNVYYADINIIQGNSHKDYSSVDKNLVTVKIHGDIGYSYTKGSYNVRFPDEGPRVILYNTTFSEKDYGRFYNMGLQYTNTTLYRPSGNYKKALAGVTFYAVNIVNIKPVLRVPLKTYELYGYGTNESKDGNSTVTYKGYFIIEKGNLRNDSMGITCYLPYYHSTGYKNATEIKTNPYGRPTRYFNYTYESYRLIAYGKEGKKYYGDFHVSGDGTYKIDMKEYAEAGLQKSMIYGLSIIIIAVVFLWILYKKKSIFGLKKHSFKKPHLMKMRPKHRDKR